MILAFPETPTRCIRVQRDEVDGLCLARWVDGEAVASESAKGSFADVIWTIALAECRLGLPIFVDCEPQTTADREALARAFRCCRVVSPRTNHRPGGCAA